MSPHKIDFLAYLSIEERQLLTSMVNFRKEFDLFFTLERIYQEPIKRLSISDNTAVVAQLYLLVHFQLYFSTTCLLRAHLSEMLSSMRKAIDASLTAYRLILDPGLSKKYIERHKSFINVKRYIEHERKKDPAKYPLAKELIKMHEGCSQYGSHADIDSFIHRLDLPDPTKSKTGVLLLHYFQFPKDDPNEFKLYFIVMLQGFFLMFIIFKQFLDDKLNIVDPEWELAIEKLGPQLNTLRQKYYAKSQGNNP